MVKPYERLKEIGWKSGNCNIIIKETGYCCNKLATYEVRGLKGNIIGKCCPEHGKETELLILGTNAFIEAKIVSKN